VTRAASTLTGIDRALLEAVLRNEADMAFRRRLPILLDYLALEDGERVLDCGCGMGFHLMVMGALRDVGLTGLDSDLARLEQAARQGVRAELVRGDAQRLPFADGCFDKMLMTEVLEHLADDVGALREAYRALRGGGILAISVPHARFPSWWDPINASWTALGGQPIRSGPIAGIWSNHERLYEPEALATAVRAAGFEIDALVETTHYSFPFIHFLVYGIGKPLLERGMLPIRLRKSADRFSGQQNTSSLLNPFNLGRSILRLVDRLNERPQVASKRTFVNVLVKARKPGGNA
jgi:ubiquinone/menaquinone biosynthesis C-methylase UbiE